MARLFSSRPLAPPSSKSAEAFLNRGSIENSSSNFLNWRGAKDGAKVASEDRIAFHC